MLVFWVLYWVTTAFWVIWMIGYPVLHVKIRKDADLSLCVGRFCGNYNN